MADYINNFYIVERRHSYSGNIGPPEFQMLWTSIYSIIKLARSRLETTGADHMDQRIGVNHRRYTRSVVRTNEFFGSAL